MFSITNEPPYRTKSRYVHATLRKAIMRCELEPGARLIIDEISVRLGVSHIPVREAISQLQAEGLVVVVPHAGASVAPITTVDIIDTFSVLEGIEVVAARMAIMNASDQEIASLDDQLEGMEAAIARDDFEAFAEHNMDFHRAVAQMTSLPMLSELMMLLLDRWDRMRRYMKVLPSRMVDAQQQHQELAKALQDRDVAAAETLLARHNRDALEAYQAHMAAVGTA